MAVEQRDTEQAYPFESLFAAYDAWYEREPGRSLFAIELRLLRHVQTWERSLSLEIGVGSGRFASALSIGFGLDPALNPLFLARRRGVRGIQGVGEALPFPTNTFDSCLLMVTLCFVEDPLTVLQESFRVLKPGGTVVLGMVLKESPWGMAYLRQGRKGHPFYSLATFYSASEVFDLLYQAGFGETGIFSSLFQPPGCTMYSPEPVRKGYDQRAGFTVFLAQKPAK